MMSSEPPLAAARRRILAAYDPELFRAGGERLVPLLADYLAAAEAGQGSVLPWRPPPAQVEQAGSQLDASPAAAVQPPELQATAERFAALVRDALARGNRLHHPRYLGHQVPPPIPLAGLFDAVGAVTNQVMAVYEMGPWATAVEHALVERLGERVGWLPGSFSGLVTHGGSLANFTALLTARNAALEDVWRRGISREGELPALVVHQDAHYCVARAAGMLGLGTDQVQRVALDDRRRMDPQRLEEALSALRRAGRTVVAVVACACATPIGAFDPLDQIAEVCQRHGVWLHVDAAHGGAALFSPRHRHLLDGLQRAESLVWDAHKMLFVPALCAFVLYRRAADRFAAFHQDAPYLFDPSAPGLAEFDSGLRTVECTKRAAAFGLWGAWCLFGPQLFADLVDVTFDLGQTLYRKLLAADDFEPLHEPQANIVVFRHIPGGLRDAAPDRLGRFQLDLRRRVVESGRFYLVSTNIDGSGALRTTLINPLTRGDHLDELLDCLRREGQRLLEQA